MGGGWWCWGQWLGRVGWGCEGGVDRARGWRTVEIGCGGWEWQSSEGSALISGAEESPTDRRTTAAVSRRLACVHEHVRTRAHAHMHTCTTYSHMLTHMHRKTRTYRTHTCTTHMRAYTCTTHMHYTRARAHTHAHKMHTRCMYRHTHTSTSKHIDTIAH